MGKEDFILLLAREGISATEESGVVMIHCTGNQNVADAIFKKAQNLAEENQFSSSYGIRYQNTDEGAQEKPPARRTQHESIKAENDCNFEQMTIFQMQ